VRFVDTVPLGPALLAVLQSPPSVSFHPCSLLIFIYTFLLPVQTGEAWELQFYRGHPEQIVTFPSDSHVFLNSEMTSSFGLNKKTIIKPTLQKTSKCGIIPVQCKLHSLHGIPYNEPGNLTKSNARTQQWTKTYLHRWLHFSRAHRPLFPLNTSFAIRFLFKRWPSFELSHCPV
jgi:hypothetical protein